MDDVVLNKAATIERCVLRVREVHAGEDRNLSADLTRQDSIVLNIQRACEAAIDLAMQLVNRRRLGVPQDSREAFQLLAREGTLPEDLAQRLQKMVGFRNVAVRDYQHLNLEILRAIVARHLDDLTGFASLCLRAGN
jgi:uncharacterized protein YutE (UPF0331/DUF86 family)